MDLLALGHATALDGSAPDWVHLLPLGKWQGVDGRGPYEIAGLAAAEKVITATRFQNDARPLAIDYDHATDLAAPQGDPAPAAG